MNLEFYFVHKCSGDRQSMKIFWEHFFSYDAFTSKQSKILFHVCSSDFILIATVFTQQLFCLSTVMIDIHMMPMMYLFPWLPPSELFQITEAITSADPFYHSLFKCSKEMYKILTQYPHYKIISFLAITLDFVCCY